MPAAISSWEGAAGSRIAWIVVTNVGEEPCDLGGPPAAALLDGAGAVLAVSKEPLGGGPGVRLASGKEALLFVAVGNWCGEPPRPPLSIGLTLPDGLQMIARPADGLAVEPPPCNGPGQPATISVAAESWTLR